MGHRPHRGRGVALEFRNGDAHRTNALIVRFQSGVINGLLRIAVVVGNGIGSRVILKNRTGRVDKNIVTHGVPGGSLIQIQPGDLEVCPDAL